MRKLWMVLSVTLVLGLVWCTIPSFGGWSWAADPVFIIDEQVVTVDIGVVYDKAPDERDFERVKVELRAPDGTPIQVLDDGGLKVKVKHHHGLEDQVKMKVTVPGKWYLEKVTVTPDLNMQIEKQQDHKWVFTFDLP